MTTANEFVDCSSNNGTPNIAAYAAAGHKHLAIKATEGTGYEFYGGHTIQDQCHQHGLTVDRYHWLRPDSGNAKQQAAFFVAAIKTHLKPGDGWFPDWETSYNYSTGKPVADPPDAVWAQFLLDFVAEVKRLLKAEVPFPVPGRLYVANWYIDGKPRMQAVAREFDAIQADYTGINPPNNRFGLKVVANQFTDRATVAGFSGPVDLNRWVAAPAVDPPIETKDWFDMATEADLKAAVREVVPEIVRDVVREELHRVLTDTTTGGDGKPHTIPTLFQHFVKGHRYASQVKGGKK